MITIKRKTLSVIVLIAAAILGGAFGYVQDNLTQTLPPSTPSFFYNIGIFGWAAYVSWTVAALPIPSIRWQSLRAAYMSLAVILIFWMATIVGGIIFFLNGGWDFLSLGVAPLFSAVDGAMYSFYLVILPIILVRAILAIRSRRQLAISG